MNRITHTIVISIFILTTSFQCVNHNLWRFGKDAELRLIPEPIYLNENKGAFEFEVNFPQSKILASSDSVVFKFSTVNTDDNLLLGVSTFIISKTHNKYSKASHRDKIEFEIEMKNDTLPILLTWILYNNGHSTLAEESWIGEIINYKK